MDKKGMSKNIIVVIIVAILAVSTIAVYLAMSGGPSDGASTDTTNNEGTTDTTNGGTTDTTNDGGTTDTTNDGKTVDVSGASSLQFKVFMDPADGDNIDYTYSVKNAGTSSLMMRIEMQVSGESFIYIINGAQEKVWMYSGDQWMDFSEMYPTYWDTWNSAWQGYHDILIDWTGVGDWTYTTPNGDSVRIYDITINPSLPDSMFEQ